MIAKVLKGSRTYGLLRYLFGPGRHEEHTDAHLVAAWDAHEADPASEPEHLRDAALYTLAQHLDRPLERATGTIARHVWHASVRLAPGDPLLSDAQWAHVARRIVAAGGLAPEGDEQGCRWVAVRHADDHVHVVATLVRQDGAQPRLRGDFYRLREECGRLELELGLRVTAQADHTAAPAPKRGERAKAHRVRGERVSARERLHAAVRPVALESTSDDDLFSRLKKAGLLVKVRRLPSGDVGGYAVALPGDLAPDGRPVWFSGSKLAPDLSLPRIRQRWNVPLADGASAPAVTRPRSAASRSRTRAGGAEQVRIETWQQAAAAVREATAVLQRGTGPEAAATAAALADLMTVAAQRSPASVRRELELAARHMERLGREPWRELNRAARRTRTALQAMLSIGPMLGRADESAAVLAFVVAVVLAARALRAHHVAARKQAHARVARLAGEHLQHAAELLGARPRARADHVAARRPDLQRAVQRAVAGRADAVAILSGPEWPALAGMLRRIEQLGHDPAAVLAGVVGWRPLRTDLRSPARRDAQVLIWRLENWIAGQRAGDGAPAAAGRAVRSTGDASRPRSDNPTPRPDSAEMRLRECLRTTMDRHADAERVLRDPGWPRLAAVLTEIDRAGHDVEGALRAVVAERPLSGDPTSPSRSDAQVLTWRLRHWLEATTSSAPAPRPPSRVAADSVPETIRDGDDRVFRRAVVAVVESQTCSPEHLERTLWVRPDKASALVRALCERGVVTTSPDGGYRVAIGVEELPALKKTLTARSSRAARLSSSTARSRPTQGENPAPAPLPGDTPPKQRRPRQR
ncbi:hypothetical protein [Nonomuraea sp. NPDC049695]|uniref:hypothetical protein n=1 Tax=Nonomuraea sp. NPDC049695 TaxID=3154734 RepID=UPI0034377034